MSKFLKALSLGTIIATLPLLAATAHAGDAEKGEKVFKKCAACHAVGEGAKNKVGPELNEISAVPQDRLKTTSIPRR